MEQVFNIKVEGMTCGNCALTITRYLEKQGLSSVSANAASGEVNFVATQAIEMERVYKGINGLGFHVIDPGEEGHDGSMHHHSGLAKWLIICAVFTFPLLFHMFAGEHSFLNNPYLQFALCVPVYAIGAWHFGSSAWRSLRNGIPNMDVLIIMGASAAFVYSLVGMFLFKGQTHHYLFFETTATIITLVLLGNFIEERTVIATTSSIKALAALQPSMAKVIMTDSIGKETTMPLESKFLKVNDVVWVNDGDSIPSDGIVIRGTATVNESMITGESLPVQKQEGSTVTGGSVLTQGNLRIRTTAVGQQTALAEIVRLVQKAQSTKPPLQRLADKISAIFVPVVLGIALLVFALNYFVADIGFIQSMMRSIAVLVIACPCAMGLATPAAVAVGLGRAAQNGILIKGGDTLEKLKDIKQVVFDKTGTLTTGILQIESIYVNGISENEFKAAVLGLEHFSTHPIARSIQQIWKEEQGLEMNDVQELKGEGMQGQDVSGNSWELGSYVMNKEKGAEIYDVNLWRNKEWVGGINLRDELRSDAKETIDALHRQGFKTILLSGDRKAKADAVGLSLGIDTVIAEQSPSQKMDQLTNLLKQQSTAMVGDGINDAPALAKADIGISLSDATKVAIQSANVILSNNKLGNLSKAIKLGSYTYQTIKQNLFWAFFYNILAIPLAGMGYLSPMWAALVMAFSDVILVLNSLRLNYRKID